VHTSMSAFFMLVAIAILFAAAMRSVHAITDQTFTESYTSTTVTDVTRCQFQQPVSITVADGRALVVTDSKLLSSLTVTLGHGASLVLQQHTRVDAGIVLRTATPTDSVTVNITASTVIGTIDVADLRLSTIALRAATINGLVLHNVRCDVSASLAAVPCVSIVAMY
jgi:hypothetical protein